MSIEALLTKHWQELIDLRAEYLGYTLTTKPADRERRERAVEDFYRLAGLEPPRQVIWFESQIETRICIALWMWMLDPFVHGPKIDPNFDPVSNIVKAGRQFLIDQREKMQTEFPRLFSDVEEPELLVSKKLAEAFDPYNPQVDIDRELLRILRTSVTVVSTNPVEIQVQDQTENLMHFAKFLESPDVPATLSRILEMKSDALEVQGYKQQLFFFSSQLRGHMIYPMNKRLTEIIVDGPGEALLVQWTAVKERLQVNRTLWDGMAATIS